MLRLELIQTPNRRAHQVDRRQCPDRRKQSAGRPGDNEAVLRELLREAHARIRTLERAVDTLKDAI